MQYETPQTSFGNILYNFLLPRRKNLDFALGEGYFTIPTSSGKAALHLILEWLRDEGVVSSKTDEILVPQWLGTWVYKTIHTNAFPQTALTPRTKAIVVYHQYGFPQDMNAIMKIARERNLVVIEDCAHALESYRQGARLGTVGDFGVFSFSKFVPSLMGGAIVTRNKEARKYFLNRIRGSRAIFAPFCLMSKYFHEYTHGPFADELMEASYALYPHHTRMTKTVQNLIVNAQSMLGRRAENYRLVKHILKGNPWIDALDRDVLPYVVPIFGTPRQILRVVEIVTSSGLYSGMYHFDEHRNLLNPNFIEIAWLPVHQGIPESHMREVSEKIKDALV